jgi:hypothetical protein
MHPRQCVSKKNDEFAWFPSACTEEIIVQGPCGVITMHRAANQARNRQGKAKHQGKSLKYYTHSDAKENEKAYNTKWSWHRAQNRENSLNRSRVHDMCRNTIDLTTTSYHACGTLRHPFRLIAGK